MRTLVIVRGVSGSGKSTYVKKHFKGCPHFEADMYFEDENGHYSFRADDLPKAHAWCKSETEKALKNKKNKTVVVSNTFTRYWEMSAYFQLAEKHRAEVKVLRMKNQYKNTHGVPDNIVEQMRSRFEDFKGEEYVK